MRVSHETIYLSLFVQSRGALRRELQRCLRTGRAMRYPRAKRLPQGRGQLRDTLHISQRPPEAADRAVPGHWEGDLVFGRRPSAVGTLVERHSRYVLLFPLLTGSRRQHAAGADRRRAAAAPAAAPLPHLGPGSGRWPNMCSSPSTLVSRSISVTRVALGSAAPTRTPMACSANTCPRAATCASFDQAALDAIAAELNGRPRQTLGFQDTLTGTRGGVALTP